jgi:dipeptidyl aminopeptidase/acylaminoacyl peptidase
LSDRAGSVQLYRIQLDGGEAEALTSWRGDISDVCPLADGRLAAVAATDEEHERRHAERDDAVLWGEQLPRSRLRLLDVSTGQIRVVRGLGDRHVVELAQRPDGGPLAVIRWASPEIDPGVFTNELHAIDPPTGAVRDLGRIEASASSPAWWRDGGSWHLTYLASPGPNGGHAVFDIAVPAASSGGQHRNLTEGMDSCPAERDTRPELRRIGWGIQERLSYQAYDGLGLDGLLILPAGKTRADGPFPLITLVHGGPYDRYADRLMLHPHAPGQWLASAGYAVFLPNPRGGAGRGHDFAVAIAGSLGGGEFTDILSGIDGLIASGVADPDRLGIGGGSHGGFMTAWAIGQTGRFRAASMGAGISDWGMLVATGEGAPWKQSWAAAAAGRGPGRIPTIRSARSRSSPGSGPRC